MPGFIDPEKPVTQTLKVENCIAELAARNVLGASCEVCEVSKDAAILSRFDGKTLCDVCLGVRLRTARPHYHPPKPRVRRKTP